MFNVPGYLKYFNKMKTLGVKTTTAIAELQYLAYLSIQSACISKRKKEAYLAVDIGTYKCVSALTMAYQMREYAIDPRVITVDNYSRPAIKGQSVDLDSYRESEYTANEKFIKQMGFNHDLITPVISNSAEYASELDDGSVSIAYFDGGHRKQDVLDDLNAYWPKMGYRSVFCGHDFCVAEPGVIEAVEEFKADHKEQLLGWGLELRFWWTIKNEKPISHSI